MATPPRLYQPRLLFVLGLQFLFGLSFSSFLLLPKFMASEFDANATLIGHVNGVAPIAAMLIIPVIAKRIDRVSRRRLLSIGCVCLALGTAGFCFLGKLGPEVYLFRILQGVGFTTYMSAATMLVTELAPRERLSQAIGLQGAANIAANALAPAIAEPIATHYGWHPVFVASTLAACLTGFGVLLVSEEPTNTARETAGPAFRDPRYLTLLYVGVVLGIAYGSVVTFYQPLALDRGITRLRDFFVGFTASVLGVRVLGGRWLDRWDRKRIALFAQVLYALVVVAAAGLQPGWLLPLGVGLGLAHGMLYPVLGAIAIESAEPHARGSTMAYFAGTFHFGCSIAMLGFGGIAETFGYPSVFVVAACFSASAVLLLLRLPVKHQLASAALPG